MISDKVLAALNKQVKLEGDSSQLYLSMSSWADNQGLEGTSKFLNAHSNEERMHMLKLISYINERNGKAIIPGIKEPQADFKGLKELFRMVYEHEVMVSKSINNLVELALNEKDFSTFNFLQWYVTEQIEEERLAKIVLDKIDLIADDKGGLYLFDNDLSNMHGAN